MDKQKYKPVNLPEELVEELKIWRQAFSNCYGTSVSYAKIIRSLLDSLDETEPDVTSEMDRLVALHPEYGDIVGKYQDSVK